MPFTGHVRLFRMMSYSLKYFEGIYVVLYQLFDIFAKLFPRINKHQRNPYFFVISDINFESQKSL